MLRLYLGFRRGADYSGRSSRTNTSSKIGAAFGLEGTAYKTGAEGVDEVRGLRSVGTMIIDGSSASARVHKN